MDHPNDREVRLGYELTYEEFAEAITGRPPVASGRPSVVRQLWGWLAAAGFTVALVVMVSGDHNPADATATTAVETPGRRAALGLVPAALFATVLGFAMLRQGRRPFPKPWEQQPAAGGRAVKPAAGPRPPGRPAD